MAFWTELISMLASIITTLASRNGTKRSGWPPRATGAATRAKLPLSAFFICMNVEEYVANCIESLEQCRLRKSQRTRPFSLGVNDHTGVTK